MNKTETTTSPQFRLPLIAIGVSVILFLLAYWGGFPQEAEPGVLAFGVIAVIATLLVFGFLVYWFYLSPISTREERGIVLNPSSYAVRQIIATAVAVMAIFIVIGFFWDELWHRLYGVGAVVDDFWWRPHILIYASMGINALFALGGMATMMLRGRGSMRQRFRSEPFVGLLTLVAGFQVVSAPLDPMWHQVYGLDITAWSLPHLMLLIGISSVMLVGASIQLSFIPSRAWRGLKGLVSQEVISIFILAFAVNLMFQFGTTEWEDLGPVLDTRNPLFQRPEWLYPVVLVSIGAFISFAGGHLLRRVGAATIIFVVALGVRIILLVVFQAAEPPVNMSLNSIILMTIPAVALDLVYFIRQRTGVLASPNTWLIGSLAMAVAVILINLPLISQIMYYPRINLSTVPGMVLFVPLMAVVAGWAGSRLGEWLRLHGQQRESAPVSVPGQNRLVQTGLAALLVILVFVAYFVITAQPPT